MWVDVDGASRLTGFRPSTLLNYARGGIIPGDATKVASYRYGCCPRQVRVFHVTDVSGQRISRRHDGRGGSRSKGKRTC